MVSRYPGIPVSQYPGIPVSWYPSIPVSRYPGIPVSRYCTSVKSSVVSEEEGYLPGSSVFTRETQQESLP
ncbi:hypothetical protein chiPu_0029656 [Chiloscyllium punctatum]|uniref:Uncharacterized protein n=1 Tax=Chiloscyllium punctatum TaxID=137246 RepID=A0A401TT32_CHIPU|nr:hypothetical protein [Chiloscyllium punctatum]